MYTETEKQQLQRKIERCRDLLREYPDGPINQTMRDYIVELEQQLHDLEKCGAKSCPSPSLSPAEVLGSP